LTHGTPWLIAVACAIAVSLPAPAAEAAHVRAHRLDVYFTAAIVIPPSLFKPIPTLAGPATGTLGPGAVIATYTTGGGEVGTVSLLEQVTLYFAQGSLRATITAGGVLGPGATEEFQGRVRFTGGTGRWAKVRGRATLTGQADGINTPFSQRVTRQRLRGSITF
jgi:hypothetical protein